MSASNKILPPIDEVMPQIRKDRLQNVTGLSIKRVLILFHDPLSRLLIRLPIRATQITLLWFAVLLAGFAISAIGTPWAFTAGALLVYVAIIIDLCDGEIGRYRARAMTPEQDFASHLRGMYLDRTFHIITTPLWPLALAWGLYRQHGTTWVFSAGAVLMVVLVLRRTAPFLRDHLIHFFRPRYASLCAEGHAGELQQLAESRDTLLGRIAGRLDLWLGNGKRFNFIILVASLADLAIWFVSEPADCRVLLTLFLACGAAGVIVIVDAASGRPLRRAVASGLQRDLATSSKESNSD